MIAETIKATQGNEGARRATEIPWDGTGATVIPDPEVPTKATRRRFTSEYKRRILKEADACTDLGALLRREGLYASNLTTWRKQMNSGRSDRPFSQEARPEGIGQQSAPGRERKTPQGE